MNYDQHVTLQTGQRFNATTDIPVPTNSKIREGVGYLEGQLNALHARISELEGRLDTVLVPSPPQNAGPNPGKAANAPASHLFDRLESLSNMATEAQNRLQNLIQRIEV